MLPLPAPSLLGSNKENLMWYPRGEGRHDGFPHDPVTTRDVIRDIKAKAPAVPFRHFPCSKSPALHNSAMLSDTQISQTKGSFLKHSSAVGAFLPHTVPITSLELLATLSTAAASQNFLLCTWVPIYPMTTSQLQLISS